ncbi:hypothetical protein SUGI_0202200 [Cryptomeria japonica]|uniref:plastid-lipid-associated protein, chloroplastic n=1 Tax=Cryptomeria japonica TaxID=3369 RepID=UPI002408C650|nr:plastid-lipid-associated protein, chloroplastic [Cryptomeria japonica]XP_057859822.2 plastid-lipid-associated protein, chloroplastic [Cryptomeria japonica]XP_057859823.2 plastid-lipid-associated protein, chloroplastic [Cryptomeria japonica]XP_057859824.2 plastid-lipid-associated protein, chloroplastic [Cryptomeria japonica]GLJ12985.1 hypothetical protein SUGI_0202200 [Cryptomeria japonica]
MAAISALHCNIPAIKVQSHSLAKPLASSASATRFPHSFSRHSQSLTTFIARSPRRLKNLTVSAGDIGDEYGEEKSDEGVSINATVTATATATLEKEEPSEIKNLKRALVDSFYGTDRGLRASSETRAEIVELITQLEAKNPTPAPTEALSLLNGKWILAYTSFSELYPLLAAGTLPLVKVQEISQKFDSETLTVENSVLFAGPLATTSFSTNATFEVRSPKRVQIKFEEGIISTPQLIDSIEIPEDVHFLGQKIDLTPFKGVLSSVQDAASSVVKTISERPPIKFPIRTDRAQSWLLTTYLDEDIRISRADGSSVFVLIKEGSPLLPPS